MLVRCTNALKCKSHYCTEHKVPHESGVGCGHGSCFYSNNGLVVCEEVVIVPRAMVDRLIEATREAVR